MHKYNVMIQFDFPTYKSIISSKPVALSFSVKQLTGCLGLGTHVAQLISFFSFILQRIPTFTLRTGLSVGQSEEALIIEFDSND